MLYAFGQRLHPVADYHPDRRVTTASRRLYAHYSSSYFLPSASACNYLQLSSSVPDDIAKMFEDVPLGVKVDAHAAKTPDRLSLVGHYAVLVPLCTSHAPILYQQLCLNSPEAIWAYMSAGPFTDEEAFTRHIDNLSTSTDPFFFTVTSKISLPKIPAGSPVGYLSLMRFDFKNRDIEIGHVTFSATLQRTTVATEALYLAMKHCIEDLGNRRLEWKCDSLNAKSRKAAERLGFVLEGVFRQHLIVRGRNRDTAWYSIVDNEWQGKKWAFQKWLEQGNFDGNGRQKKGLVDLRRVAETEKGL